MVKPYGALTLSPGRGGRRSPVAAAL